MRIRALLGRAFRSVFPRRWPALDGIDRKLVRHLPHRNGFFVELGANDGISQSNTYHFERYRGWRGILVEPIPRLFKKCKRNRPNSRVLNFACVAPEFDGDHVNMVDCNLMSIVKGARGSREEDEEFIRDGMRKQDCKPREVSVPATTLTSLLDKCRCPHIDLLSLDVEGYELEVLKGLDMTKYRPDFIVIEVNSREAVEESVRPWYEPVEELTFRDILYRAKT